METRHALLGKASVPTLGSGCVQGVFRIELLRCCDWVHTSTGIASTCPTGRSSHHTDRRFYVLGSGHHERVWAVDGSEARYKDGCGSLSLQRLPGGARRSSCGRCVHDPKVMYEWAVILPRPQTGSLVLLHRWTSELAEISAHRERVSPPTFIFESPCSILNTLWVLPTPLPSPRWA